MLRKWVDALLVVLIAVTTSQFAAAWDATDSLKVGDVALESAGPMTFGPDGVLFVGDTKAAAIHAIATGDVKGDIESKRINVEGIDQKVAAALGTSASDIIINDMVINPSSGNAYLSVSRGRGADAAAIILRVDGEGTISEVDLTEVKCAKAGLPNAPAPGGEGRGNQRAQSITDLNYIDGKLVVAGLSNEEFASKLHTIQYPFGSIGSGTSVEVFHGAHGRLETRSPIRTFAMMVIDKEPYVVAAYTCTPLVKFPLTELTGDQKVTGTTVAELGNRNRPLDMVVYSKEGKDYILMANSARGVMKISTEGINREEGIESRVAETAGQKYETIAQLEGVAHLARLNNTHAVIIQESDGRTNLKTIELP